MSLPLLEQFERGQTEGRQRQEAAHQAAIAASSHHAWEQETEKLMRSNGHSQNEINEVLAAGPQVTPSAGAATGAERDNPRNYTPPSTLLGGSAQGSHVTAQGRKETEAALNESGANSIEGQLTRATQGAREGGEKAGEDLEKVAKAEVNLPNPLSWTEAIANVFSKLAEGSFWVRVLKFVMGAGLLVIAIVLFARSAGLGAENPVTAATQEASQAVTGRARANQQRQTNVSDSTRKRVQEGVNRETRRDHTERGKSGKPLSGGALTQRQRARIRQRDATLSSTRELAKGSKRR
jgi:hypothetical protein